MGCKYSQKDVQLSLHCNANLYCCL